MASLRNKNSVDMLARDVAFEIVLGGDRFDPGDVSKALDGISEGDMKIFKDRIAYHAVDFAPEEYRTQDFLSRMIEAWTGDVRLGKDQEIHKDFLDAAQTKDRGKWFHFSNGDYRRCDRAVVEAMWTEKDRMMMDPKPVEPFVVARAKVDSLISKYGVEVMSDGPDDVVDIDSYGMTSAGHIMTVKRNVDILATKVEDHIYSVTIRTPEGASTNLLSDYTPEQMNTFIDLIDTERSRREAVSLVSDYVLQESAIVVLPKNTYILAPDGYSPSRTNQFEASSVFFSPDGTAMVSGRFLNEPKNASERNFRLNDLSDRSIAIIKEATDVSMKNILPKLASLELGGLKNEVPARKSAGKSL